MPIQTMRAFQSEVTVWVLTCFGVRIASDKQERNHRFLEESLELVQACGCTASEAHQLVDYVFGRQQGKLDQELGGVLVTLAALARVHHLDMEDAANAELARVWEMSDAIRAKQAAKPKHSPLPEHTRCVLCDIAFTCWSDPSACIRAPKSSE